ncbi:MAG TPA: tRNA pseudouridine(13) synthase TruD, partial [Thermoflexia bacterium]|nr:tRNA pseudouridine(13) synthase TruD [Thermoflexia bacterium]
VEARVARLLRRPRSGVRTPALKDKEAVAIQYLTVRGDGPDRLEGPGFVAERVGHTSRPLEPSDLEGNRFTVVVRDLGRGEAEEMGRRLERLGREGQPNYFDQQRFGSQTEVGDWPGKRILLRDAEGALRAHLAEPMVGDPPPVRAFKRIAAERWGHWDALLEAAPRPSNYRSVPTYLRDHPDDYRRALNLITPRLLRLYLAAYQSLLWNRIVARYLLARVGEPSGWVGIAGERLPLFAGLNDRLPTDAAVPLPFHRATYDEPTLAAVVEEVLGEEGLTLSDLKPRILRRAYLPRGKRRLLLLPRDVSASSPTPDDRFPGRYALTLAFTLPPGSYATLVLKAAAATRDV